jgi:bacteriocin-like protein
MKDERDLRKANPDESGQLDEKELDQVSGGEGGGMILMVPPVVPDQDLKPIVGELPIGPGQQQTIICPICNRPAQPKCYDQGHVSGCIP